MYNTNILHVSTYPPKKCGIATYTQDVIAESKQNDPSFRHLVMAVNGEEKHNYPLRVVHSINGNNPDEYNTAAQTFNSPNIPIPVDVVDLQFENGLYGSHGQHIIDFMQKIDAPVVLTPHTAEMHIEGDPDNTKRREILKEVADLSSRILAISTGSKRVLEDLGTDPDKIHVIYHGIHPLNESKETSKYKLKERLNGQYGKLQGKTTISTVGFISPNKGLEYAIQAMPEVLKDHDNVVYFIAGSSPKNSQEYLDRLRELIKELNLEDHVFVIEGYHPKEDLLRLINISDIGVLPYTNPNQISSGIASQVAGQALPVVTTRFPYAESLFGEGRGVFVNYKDPSSTAKGINKLLSNKQLRADIRRKIGNFSPRTHWDNVIETYHSAWIPEKQSKETTKEEHLESLVH